MRTVADESLLARRRTVETAALASRGLGIVCTLLYSLGIAGLGPSITTEMQWVCWGGLVTMTAATVMAYLGRIRPASRWYPHRSALQVALDTVTILAFVTLSERESAQTTWPLLGVAVAIAAIRHRLPGALIVFAVTATGYIVMVPDSPDMPFVIGVNAMIAMITGSQSSAFARQLTALHETRQALQYQATHDSLTGLPNRAQLAGHADREAGRPLAVLLLDLNGFKQVNDTYGHAAGDRLLHEIGVRLTGVLGDGGLAGRLGGDEFLVLLPEADPAAVAPAVERIRAVVRRPIDLGDGREVTVGVSVGVAVRAAGGDATLDTLTAEADAAMYREKRNRSLAA